MQYINCTCTEMQIIQVFSNFLYLIITTLHVRLIETRWIQQNMTNSIACTINYKLSTQYELLAATIGNYETWL